MSVDINDVRTIKQFKNATFSNYKKSDVKKELIQSIYNHKIEEACYWISEFICSGQLIDAWDTILLIMSKLFDCIINKGVHYCNTTINTNNS